MAITPQHITLTTKRVVNFIAESLLYPALPITLPITRNMSENVPFPRASQYFCPIHILVIETKTKKLKPMDEIIKN